VGYYLSALRAFDLDTPKELSEQWDSLFPAQGGEMNKSIFDVPTFRTGFT
jgi:hypothetical protein